MKQKDHNESLSAFCDYACTVPARTGKGILPVYGFTIHSERRRRVQVASTAARWIKKNQLTARGLRGYNFTAWALRGELTSASPLRRPVLPIWADHFNTKIRAISKLEFFTVMRATPVATPGPLGQNDGEPMVTMRTCTALERQLQNHMQWDCLGCTY
jgi:hypothetical protein